jgi:exodeoxyribonuclease VII small subunit
MAQTKKTTRNYQAMAAELAGYIEWFESDAVNLDEAIKKYEQAMELLEEMEKYLKSAQNKISKIRVKFE